MAVTDLLRPLTPADHAWVLALNARNVELLSPLDEERLAQLVDWSDGAHVIQHAGAPAGFVLTFGPGTPYDSENYRWFSDRYSDFVYLDRIVLSDDHRRLGLGSRTYAALEAELRGRPMALEVNVDPPNEPSLAFHTARGYVEVSRLGAPGKQVSLMTGPALTEETQCVRD